MGILSYDQKYINYALYKIKLFFNESVAMSL
jgi:hypothetical protein